MNMDEIMKIIIQTIKTKMIIIIKIILIKILIIFIKIKKILIKIKTILIKNFIKNNNI